LLAACCFHMALAVTSGKNRITDAYAKSPVGVRQQLVAAFEIILTEKVYAWFPVRFFRSDILASLLTDGAQLRQTRMSLHGSVYKVLHRSQWRLHHKQRRQGLNRFVTAQQSSQRLFSCTLVIDGFDVLALCVVECHLRL